MRAMRFEFLVLFLPCVGCGPPAQWVDSTFDATGSTHVDDVDVTLDLPGRWHENRRDDSEHEIENGLQLVSFALIQVREGLDPSRVVTHLARLQARLQAVDVARWCRRGTVASAPTPVATVPGALRSYVACDDPHGVITRVALSIGSDVLSYRHVWPGTRGYSAALDRADDAILASLQIHPLATSCPNVVLEQAASGGACLETETEGQAAVERCSYALVHRGWKRDDAAAQVIGSQTSKTLVCYRRPAPPAHQTPSNGE